MNCPTCGGTLDESHLDSFTTNWKCPKCGFLAYTKQELRQAQQVAELQIKLIMAGADAERLAHVLMNTVNFFVGDTNVLAVLEQHDASAKIFKAEGG